ELFRPDEAARGVELGDVRVGVAAVVGQGEGAAEAGVHVGGAVAHHARAVDVPGGIRDDRVAADEGGLPAQPAGPDESPVGGVFGDVARGGRAGAQRRVPGPEVEIGRAGEGAGEQDVAAGVEGQRAGRAVHQLPHPEQLTGGGVLGQERVVGGVGVDEVMSAGTGVEIDGPVEGATDVLVAG